MVLIKNTHKRNGEESDNQSLLNEYNLKGIPFQHIVHVNDLNFLRGNVVRDIHRAIILKPITRERIKEVMVEEIDEKVVYVPQVQVVDKYVEIVKPVIRYKIKEVKRPVTVEKIKEVTKIVEEEKIVEVPEIQYVEKVVEVPQVVEKERIIEVPLPVVRERRIPVLNITRNERIQEVDGLEYRSFNSSSDISDSSSIDMHSSLSSVPTNQHQGQTTRTKPQEEVRRRILPKEVSRHDFEDSEINESGSTIKDHQSLTYYSSQKVNYNTSEEREQMIEQFSETSSTRGDRDRETGQELARVSENKIEIQYGLEEPDDEDDYPKMGELSITESMYKSENGVYQERKLEIRDEIREEEDTSVERERVAADVRKSNFESRVLISPRLEAELSKKLIKNMSTQVIPKTIRLVEKKKKLKDKKGN